MTQTYKKTCIINKLGGRVEQEVHIGLNLLRSNCKLITKTMQTYYWQLVPQIHVFSYYSQHLYFTFSSLVVNSCFYSKLYLHSNAKLKKVMFVGNVI